MLAIGRWVQFTERFSFSPRLWEKIANTAKRGSLTQHRQILLALGLPRTCFYCNRQLDQDWHIDHFLPWSFVLEDRLWNLVPSCQSCNSSKSDGVPTRKVEALAKRNEWIFDKLDDTSSGLLKRDFKEWAPDALFEQVILLTRNALGEGFPEWNGRDSTE